MAQAPLNAPPPEPARVEWEQVQRLALQGYVRHSFARFTLLRVEDRARATAWIGKLLASGDVEFGWGHSNREAAASIAFSATGLSALGLDAATIEGFSPEFAEGMVTDARSRILRDLDASAPPHWYWGNTENPVHVVFALYAKSAAGLARAVDSYQESFASAGLAEVRGPSGSEIGACHALDKRHEHFGFTDGISQPRYRDEPAGLRSKKAREADRIATGELLLGYANEAGIFPRSPKLSSKDPKAAALGRSDLDFGKNGSYLVYRQLEQDVGGFWRATALVRAGATPQERVAFAAKMIGRWPDGTPLAKAIAAPGAPVDPEAFDFALDDPYGDGCPLSAHVRRANPRSTLAVKPEIGLAKSKKHRILRRGRSYGEPFVATATPEELIAAADAGGGQNGPRGLHFLCFNADIANQFEFIQQTWINGTVFQGLHGEVDAVLGDPSATGGLMTVPECPARKRVHGIPRFVEVRGGAYFFAPSRAALAYLSGSNGPVR